MTKYLEPDDKMTPQEKRQQQYRERYKQMNPSWDDSIMMLARFFGERAKPEMVVLDAGCGRSNFVLQKKPKGHGNHHWDRRGERSDGWECDCRQNSHRKS